MTSAAHIIVFGSDHGGSGKSTAAMHVAVGLVRLGYKVASVDLDAQKGTLTQYMANRFDYCETECPDLPSPAHLEIEKDNVTALKDQEKEGKDFLRLAIENLKNDYDFIVIDTPTSDDFFVHLAESYSDTLITVISTRFSGLIETAERICKLRAQHKAKSWIILHNRLAHAQAVQSMMDLPGIKLIPGFEEREVFQQLFPRGLTLLDLKETSDLALTMPALAARQEVRQLLRAIGPEKLKGYPQKRSF